MMFPSDPLSGLATNMSKKTGPIDDPSYPTLLSIVFPIIRNCVFHMHPRISSLSLVTRIPTLMTFLFMYRHIKPTVSSSGPRAFTTAQLINI